MKNYAELAVELAMTDVTKLIKVIARWEYLPKEVFQRVIEYLQSPEARQRPETERFALWQKLVDEVDRHRKCPESDWAMPEEELQRLEHAAEAIKPADPAVIHQRLFNDYDRRFFTGSDYKVEAKKLAQTRTEAVGEILRAKGALYFLEMAKAVKLPIELGIALGRIGGAELDQLILPSLLEAEKPLADLMAGYVWARYFAATIEWVRSVDLSQWTPTQTGTFFSRLPFTQDVWTLAEARLGEARAEYWSRVGPNPYQAENHLLEAAQKSLANGRPDLAVACLNAMRHLKANIPTALATAAVKQLLTKGNSIRRFDPHELLELVNTIQAAPDASEADVCWIEFHGLSLLDQFSGSKPVFLERRLANEPPFFHEVITACFRSEQDVAEKIEPNSETKALAAQTYRLLHNWSTPPGTTREQKLDQAAFAKWFTEVRSLCEASGHWVIAQQMIGKTLMYAPAGLEEMLNLPVVAKMLDAPEHDHARRGLEMELSNSRGVHGFSGGKDELKLAADFREHAAKYDLAIYPRVAAMLRSLAEGYEREAERDAKRGLLDD